MRLILWGMILAVAAGAITWMIFWLGAEWQEKKIRREERRKKREEPIVMDTPRWKPPTGPYEGP